MAILALIVFTALGSGNYKSMLPAEWLESAAVEAAEEIVAEPAAEELSVEADDAATAIGDVTEVDSLQVDIVE